jgi:Tol biopolymer transport system component
MNIRKSLNWLHRGSKGSSISSSAFLYVVGVVGVVTLAVTAAFLQWTNEAAAAGKATQTAASSIYFEENRGQFNDRVRYLVHGTTGYSLFLTSTEAVYVISEQTRVDRDRKKTNEPQIKKRSLSAPRPERAVAVYVRLAGANQRAVSEASFEQPHRTNYLLGSNKDEWVTGVPNYAQVRTREVYPGVDLVWRADTNGELSYDLNLGSDAEQGQIAWEIEGADDVEITPEGGLVVKTKFGDVHPKKPITSRSSDGNPITEGHYVLLEKGKNGVFRVAFEIAEHFPQETPKQAAPEGTGGLQYSTYIGGGGAEVGRQIAIDSAGNSYITSDTNFTNFPTTPGVFDPNYSGTGYDAVVTKLNPAGSALVYSTYLGGTLSDQTTDIKIDAAGNAYVLGVTVSTDFPTTAGAFDTTSDGTFVDSFVTKLNADGTALIYSTYLGGAANDFAYSLALNSDGNVYVAGIADSSDFPITAGVYDSTPASDSFFITKLDPSGATLVYSTFLSQGGTFDCNIAIDSAGNAYVSGDTQHALFPTTAGAFDTTFGGGIFDGFVAKLNPTGSALIYSTFLGGSGGDAPNEIVLDSLNNAYVVGYTSSSNFPTTVGAYDTTYGNNSDVFVTKINPTGSALVYSTYIGGTNTDFGRGIALDSSNNAYVTGYSSSIAYPTTAGAVQTTLTDEDDVFVTKLNVDGTSLLYSTLIGARFDDSGYGIKVDAAGTAYVTGLTQELNFPTTPGAFDRSFNGNTEIFVLKLVPAPAPPPIPPSIPPGKLVFYTNRDGNSEIYSMNSDGTTPVRLTNDAGSDTNPDVTNDGTKITFVSNRDGNGEIYIMNADGTGQVRLTNNTTFENFPVFNSDGTKIAFIAVRDGGAAEVFVMNSDGTGQTALTDNVEANTLPAFSPDGTKIVFRSDRDGNSEIYVMNVDGSNETRLTNTPEFESNPDYSPDGSKIIYESKPTSDSSNNEIFIMDADGTDPIQLTLGHFSNESAPAFNPDGTWVTFSSNFNALTGTDVYVVKADGSIDPVRLTNWAGNDSNSSWAPAPLTAAGVSVSGRVLTVEGRGVRGAVVSITDSTGQIRTATTGSLGVFRFDDIPTGENYIVTVRSRRFNFDTRVLQVFDNLTDVDFVAGIF